jgi:hypothetical protein
MAGTLTLTLTLLVALRALADYCCDRAVCRDPYMG